MAATLDLTLGLTPPVAVEVRVTVPLSLNLGLTGIGKAYVTRSASLSTLTGLTARGGFRDTGLFSTTLGLSGTVGPFLDGIGTVNTALGLSGSGRSVVPALFTTRFTLAGIPDVSGGTVSTDGTIGIVFGLTGFQGIGSTAALDVDLGLTGSASAVFPTIVTDMRMTFAKDDIRLFWRKS